MTLPIDALRERFLSLIEAGPVVLTSPTGSGKSTQVPRWCPGPVLVVEPRRVACRMLAQRVAELEGASLGGEVGYHVRDDERCSDRTRILFATPGIVLRQLRARRFETVILDEFHERGLETDLLLALLQKTPPPRLVVMSATMDADRVATHLGGARLHAEVRSFPVVIKHVADGNTDGPDASKVERNVRRALDLAAEEAGDILVFLPGKAEISRLARGLSARRDLAILELHGGMDLSEQRRAFEPSDRRKVVLATNVAETSITLPGVGVVIDAGLARQTRYHQGRGYLTLGAIARDSADQRTGRAGRTGPGVCFRLWGAGARLDPVTAPEVHRESLVPLLLAAAAWGERPKELPFLDPPRPYALADAAQELQALGALDGGALTPLGRELFDLPLDPSLARLLVESRRAGCLDDVIDLVAALSVRRSLFLPGERPADDLRAGGCDVTALVRAVRDGRPDEHGLDGALLDEARQNAARLRRGHGLDARPPRGRPVDREAVLRAALAADPRCAHVARVRGREVAFSNGGTEIELGRESAIHDLKDPVALVVLATTALGLGLRETRVLITCASSVSLRQLEKAGLGRDHLSEVMLDRGRVVARIERVYAKKVLSEREEPPTGPVAREAIARLFTRGRIFAEAQRLTAQRLRATALLRKLVEAGLAPGPAPAEPPPLEEWALARLEALGVESGDDLALLSAGDLTAPDLDYEARSLIDRTFPLEVSLGDAHYQVDYDLTRRQATLRMVRGSRRDPPPAQFLPPLGGFRVCVEGPSGMWIVRP